MSKKKIRMYKDLLKGVVTFIFVMSLFSGILPAVVMGYIFQILGI